MAADITSEDREVTIEGIRIVRRPGFGPFVTVVEVQYFLARTHIVVHEKAFLEALRQLGYTVEPPEEGEHE